MVEEDWDLNDTREAIAVLCLNFGWTRLAIDLENVIFPEIGDPEFFLERLKIHNINSTLYDFMEDNLYWKKTTHLFPEKEPREEPQDYPVQHWVENTLPDVHLVDDPTRGQPSKDVRSWEE